MTIIFDMDGVIIDSEPIHLEADKLTIRHFGGEITDEDLRRFVGLSDKAMWAELSDKIDYPIPGILEKQAYYKKHLFGSSELTPIEGIPELLEELKSSNVRIGLASSSTRVLIDMVLENLGLNEYFQAIVSGDDVAKSKPAPDIFFKTAALLDTLPSECTVIEDSAHGVRGAKQAGMKCIGFQNLSSGVQDLSQADFVVNSIWAVKALI